jgi:ubiquinone/menaquinone biosynthesis C-methylase UbiE
MVAVARRTYPGLRFDVGSMTALDLADGCLGGIVAWYSIIHTPPEQLPLVFGEFHRVLPPGGYLLLAFQVGDECVHLEQAYGHALSLDAYRLPSDRIADLLGQAGFVMHAQLLREPSDPERNQQAYVLVRKSAKS